MCYRHLLVQTTQSCPTQSFVRTWLIEGSYTAKDAIHMAVELPQHRDSFVSVLWQIKSRVDGTFCSEPVGSRVPSYICCDCLTHVPTQICSHVFYTKRDTSAVMVLDNSSLVCQSMSQSKSVFSTMSSYIALRWHELLHCLPGNHAILGRPSQPASS